MWTNQIIAATLARLLFLGLLLVQSLTHDVSPPLAVKQLFFSAIISFTPDEADPHLVHRWLRSQWLPSSSSVVLKGCSNHFLLLSQVKKCWFLLFIICFFMLRPTKNTRKMDVQDFQTWNLSAALPTYLLVPFFLEAGLKTQLETFFLFFFCRPTATQKERQFWLFLSASKKIIQVAHKVGFLARLGVHS